MRNDPESGFSLVEAIIATGLLAGALVSLGQMLAISVAANRSARARSYATVLAQQKIEQLRGLTWGFDTLGAPVSDAISETIDYVDEAGNAVAAGRTPPSTIAYVRRWLVEPLPANSNTIIIQVIVTASAFRPLGEVRLTTVKTRKPR